MEDSGKGQRYRGALQHEVKLVPLWGSSELLTSHLHQLSSFRFSVVCLYLPVWELEQTLPALPLLLGHLPGGLGDRNSNPVHLLRLTCQVGHLWGRADLSSFTFRLKAPRLVREPRSRVQRCRKERRRRAQHSRAGCRKVSEEGLISSAERGSSLGEAGCEVWVHLALASPACSATGPRDTLLFSLSHFSHL